LATKFYALAKDPRPLTLTSGRVEHGICAG
jgi:hypothetical protein